MTKAKVSKLVKITSKCSRGGCDGLLWSIPLSRLEEGLGHEGYQCEKCGAAWKLVPNKPKLHPIKRIPDTEGVKP